MKPDPEPLKLPALENWSVEPATDEEVRRFDSPLKVLPKHGVCLWWPENGKDCLHPEDIKVGSSLIPSNRVLAKTICENPVDVGLGYSTMKYGELSFRLKPTLWLEIESDGYLIGDQVEIKSRFGKNQQMIVEIAEMLWNKEHGAIEYKMLKSGVPIGQIFANKDFRFSARIGEVLSARERLLLLRDESMLGF